MEDPSSSSSIGENSSFMEDHNGNAEQDEEVQSSSKGPLNQMRSLEDSLPIKRGLSDFYNGKSRSFTCLSDAMYSKDIVKPEDAYARKRKILRAHSSNTLDRHRSFSLHNSSSGIFKKSSHSIPTYLTSVVEINTESNTQEFGKSTPKKD